MDYNVAKRFVREQAEQIFIAQSWDAGKLCEGDIRFYKNIDKFLIRFHGIGIYVLPNNKFSVGMLTYRTHKEFSIMHRAIFSESGWQELQSLDSQRFTADFTGLENMKEAMIATIKKMEHWCSELDFEGYLKNFHKTEKMSQWHITALAWQGDFVPLLEYQQDYKEGRTLRFEKAHITLADIDRAIDIALERSA